MPIRRSDAVSPRRRAADRLPLARPRTIGPAEPAAVVAPAPRATSSVPAKLAGGAVRPAHDRRRTPRRMRSDLCAAFEVPGMRGGDQGFGIVMDLSDQGLCVRTPQPPAPGGEVVLRIAVLEEVVVLRTVVRRADEVRRGIYDVGLELIGWTPEQLALLHKVLQHR